MDQAVKAVTTSGLACDLLEPWRFSTTRKQKLHDSLNCLLEEIEQQQAGTVKDKDGLLADMLKTAVEAYTRK